jgi:hypothetical protein
MDGIEFHWHIDDETGEVKEIVVETEPFDPRKVEKEFFENPDSNMQYVFSLRDEVDRLQTENEMLKAKYRG